MGLKGYKKATETKEMGGVRAIFGTMYRIRCKVALGKVYILQTGVNLYLNAGISSVEMYFQENFVQITLPFDTKKRDKMADLLIITNIFYILATRTVD